MNHLVLGSEGQIGSHLVQHLTEQGVNCFQFDILRSETEDLRWYNSTLLLEKVKECDFVYFLAFDVGGSLYMSKYQDTYDFISNNTKIMNNVFDAVKLFNKPFIFASSQMSNMFHSTYGILKSIGECYTRSLGGLTVKFWNVYGHEKDPEKTHVITDFIKMALNGKKIIMRTNGQEERQFLYAEDCSECLYLLSQRYLEIDRKNPLHVTSFEWTSIIEIAQIISSEFGHCDIIPNDKIDTLQQGIKNDPDRYILNFWTPKTPLRDGIRKVINLMSEVS